ncbi:hypothetical protein RF11_15034 [Thelohanellus kitauei]|uniref:Guanylate kinase/L-type calcium channel beta subunit domain-containing protein n=1 Tax=Thelohanellus kitauei TaxID=669202 RepID=A0A0C2MHI2_THEKT|nr:hypothetical protein RF11_15034 [Thelohanellus kitauei]
MIKQKDFIEWKFKKANYFGYTKKSLFEVMENKRIPILGIRTKSLPTVRNIIFQPLTVFLRCIDQELCSGCQRDIEELYDQREENEVDDFESVRHLTDFYLEYCESVQVCVDLLRIIQTPKTSFVPKSWIKG